MRALFIILLALLAPSIASAAGDSSPLRLMADDDWGKVKPADRPGDTHPPIPPAPPPPPPPRVFLVFFDWSQAGVTPVGMQVAGDAAMQYRASGAVQLQVTPGDNLRLSERRADNVASALNRLGVPTRDLLVSGRGDNDPRVPTPRGVREPQNDRVEIVFP